MRIETHDLDGTGSRRVHVYDMPMVDPASYWGNVTDVQCPICRGTIRWAEAGYVPGYRICDSCGRHFIAGGDDGAPTLIRFLSHRGGQLWRQQIRPLARK